MMEVDVSRRREAVSGRPEPPSLPAGLFPLSPPEACACRGGRDRACLLAASNRRNIAQRGRGGSRADKLNGAAARLPTQACRPQVAGRQMGGRALTAGVDGGLRLLQLAHDVLQALVLWPVELLTARPRRHQRLC
jgi:hypothetical protein